MADALSPRLQAVVAALPLESGMRVLEVGCGTGAMARAIARRVGTHGRVLGIDRSVKAIAAAERGSAELIGQGTLEFRAMPVEQFSLHRGEAPYDLIVAIRVGALDGRHPELQAAALARLADASTPGTALYIDGGDPLRTVPLPRHRYARRSDRSTTAG